MYSLYLDDIRNPSFPAPYGDWEIARSVEAALKIIKDKGFPLHISFDHDLGEQVETGFSFAKLLVENDLDKLNEFPDDFTFHVHSANPVGKQNIEGLLNSYLSYKKEFSK